MRLRGLVPLIVCALAAPVASAQLISPGKLTAVHAELDGIRNCTQCHQLGRRGVSAAKCLSCHTPLRDRIRQGEGLHANVVQTCASCHSDHHGRGYDIARFDEPRFRHELTGFRLVGEHRGVSCRSCHTPERVVDPAVRRRKAAAGRLGETYLGLAGTCQSCHRSDNPHSSAVGTDCASCHSATGWERVARFDHRQTGFALVGAHVQASCASCHGARGRRDFDLATTCQSCHASETPHSRSLGTDCASCHTAADWTRTPSFRHDRTAFALTGAHVRAGCASCHGAPGRRDFDVPTDCQSCHASDSPHGRSLAGQTCATCHQTSAWSAIGGFDHGQTGFALSGAHVRLDCAGCHGSGRAARFDGTAAECASCHADESPHAGQFAGQSCGSCHGDAAWAGAARFRHERTGFALSGAHAEPDCTSCHATQGGVVQFEGVAAECQTCHDDAHDGTLGADCQTCHAPAAWDRLAATFDADRFDHDAQTGFALVGAHARADCAGCHTPGAAPGIAVTLLDDDGATFPAVEHQACLSCHQDPHDGAFRDAPGGADCASCHGQDAFRPAAFGRARHAETAFALTGAHVAVPCSACHTARPDAPPVFGLADACESCHAEENPHDASFETAPGVTACGSCHSPAQWDLASFDHAQTGFALGGAHAGQDCASCHTPETDADGAIRRTFRGLSAECASCHDTPHQGQFGGTSCDTCHDDRAFTVETFDHDRTAFSLTGAHQAVACASCHTRETSSDGTLFVRFKPLPTTCIGCHADGDAP